MQLVETAPLRHLLALPTAPQPGAPPPVLCFLHGFDEAAPADIHRALTMHGPLRPDVPSLVRERFVVVAPQLPTAGDLWHRYADVVRELVEETRRAHGGDARRTYLTGFSYGGNGVLDLALRQPGAWAALWPVDPTRVPLQDPARPVWLSIGEVARRRTSGFVRALRLQDAACTPAGERLYLDEGADHVGAAHLAYGDARIYEWLLTQRL